MSSLATGNPRHTTAIKPDPKKIIDEAMQLEPNSRALVAEALLESLDLGPDFEISGHGHRFVSRRVHPTHHHPRKALFGAWDAPYVVWEPHGLLTKR